MPPDWYPDRDEDEVPTEGKTVRLTKTESDELDLVKDLYTAMDQARGKRRPKWKDQTVIRRAVRIFLDGFWDQFAQGRPSTPEQRSEFVRAAIDKLMKQAQSKKR